MIRKDLGDVFLTVISHKRPDNVERMTKLVGPATWCVGEDEGAAYAEAGAAAVVETGALCRSRNAAIDMAQLAARPCVELSDDLTKVQLAVWSAERSKIVAQDCPFGVALGRVLEGMLSTGAQLGGVAPTANPFYANVAKPIHPSAFIVGDFIVIGVETQLRFDEKMTLKEDYMYTLDHITTHGCVARRDDVLVTFLHRKNAGGACAVRTPELEQENIALLKAKYPHFVGDNPRRPNEILLKLPRVPRATR